MNSRSISRVVFLLALVAVLCTGCGSLSLFSSRHVHYHGSDKADQKISQLEARVEALEKK